MSPSHESGLGGNSGYPLFAGLESLLKSETVLPCKPWELCNNELTGSKIEKFHHIGKHKVQLLPNGVYTMLSEYEEYE